MVLNSSSSIFPDGIRSGFLKRTFAAMAESHNTLLQKRLGLVVAPTLW